MHISVENYISVEEATRQMVGELHKYTIAKLQHFKISQPANWTTSTQPQNAVQDRSHSISCCGWTIVTASYPTKRGHLKTTPHHELFLGSSGKL